MMKWLTKFRISAALDSGSPLPESLRRVVAADPELARFAQRTKSLGHALRRDPVPVAPSMHDSIMRAVRTASRESRPQRPPASSWLAATAALATVLAIAAVCLFTWQSRQARSNKQSLNEAVKVLEMSEQMPKDMPALVLAPLSDEWARMDRDLQKTGDVLMASLP
jgi:hypothetical protein